MTVSVHGLLWNWLHPFCSPEQDAEFVENVTSLRYRSSLLFTVWVYSCADSCFKDKESTFLQTNGATVDRVSLHRCCCNNVTMWGAHFRQEDYSSGHLMKVGLRSQQIEVIVCLYHHQAARTRVRGTNADRVLRNSLTEQETASVMIYSPPLGSDVSGGHHKT